jgi:amidase
MHVRDTLNAFVDYPYKPVAAAAGGILAGTTLAVKDIFDLAGYPTGAGNPEVRIWQGEKTKNALAVQALLDAGARVVGKTHTDEFAYSMNGENVHYGTPVNPRAPGRIPGGSSSGSAVAVAGGLADIALGSDTGGSIRLPASYCGLIGLRPTHGRIAMDGVFPLCRSFDTVGWFAKDAETYLRVAGTLLGPDDGATAITMLRPASDVVAQVLGPDERAETERCFAAMSRQVQFGSAVTLCPEGFAEWRPHFRTIQAYEVWRDHGSFLAATRPAIGPGIRERLEWAETVSAESYARAMQSRWQIAERIRALVRPGTALVFPTAPSVAPLLGMAGDALESYRQRAISMLCAAGLAGLPQISLPIGSVDGLPFGISLMGCPGADWSLLRLGVQILSAVPTSDAGSRAD